MVVIDYSVIIDDFCSRIIIERGRKGIAVMVMRWQLPCVSSSICTSEMLLLTTACSFLLLLALQHE